MFCDMFYAQWVLVWIGIFFVTTWTLSYHFNANITAVITSTIPKTKQNQKEYRPYLKVQGVFDLQLSPLLRLFELRRSFISRLSILVLVDNCCLAPLSFLFRNLGPPYQSTTPKSCNVGGIGKGVVPFRCFPPIMPHVPWCLCYLSWFHRRSICL